MPSVEAVAAMTRYNEGADQGRRAPLPRRAPPDLQGRSRLVATRSARRRRWRAGRRSRIRTDGFKADLATETSTGIVTAAPALPRCRAQRGVAQPTRCDAQLAQARRARARALEARRRESAHWHVMGPRERPKEGTTPVVERPTSAAGSHPQSRLFGAGLPPRTQANATPLVASSTGSFVQPCPRSRGRAVGGPAFSRTAAAWRRDAVVSTPASAPSAASGARRAAPLRAAPPAVPARAGGCAPASARQRRRPARRARGARGASPAGAGRGSERTPRRNGARRGCWRYWRAGPRDHRSR